MAVIAPRKKTVGTAKAWIDNQRTVKIGYVVGDFFVVIVKFKYVRGPTVACGYDASLNLVT